MSKIGVSSFSRYLVIVYIDRAQRQSHASPASFAAGNVDEHLTHGA